MSDPIELPRVWRVGLVSDPLGFVPADRRTYGNRFDDVHRRFGTLYCAHMPETALREVLAWLRPDTAELARHFERYGREAPPSATVVARWRRDNVLAPARLQIDGSIAGDYGAGPDRIADPISGVSGILDLTDLEQRHAIELQHADLLASYGMSHLDLHEVTSKSRVVTQTIAADAFDRLGASAIRFASRLDGRPCYALFEGRAGLVGDGEPLALTDPAPGALLNVAAAWRLRLDPTRPIAPPTVHQNARTRGASASARPRGAPTPRRPEGRRP